MKPFLPLLADFANGIFAVFIAGYITNTDLVWYHFIVGLLLAMIPDLDAIPELFSRGGVAAYKDNVVDHREYFHFPLLFIIVGVLFIQVNVFYGWVFLIAVMFHFANDMYGTGWGVALFWPITKTRFKFFERKVNQMRKTLHKNNLWEGLDEHMKNVRLLVSWKHGELKDYVRRYGYEDWIEEHYLSLNWASVMEYSLFVFALVLVVFHFV